MLNISNEVESEFVKTNIEMSFVLQIHLFNLYLIWFILFSLWAVYHVCQSLNCQLCMRYWRPPTLTDTFNSVTRVCRWSSQPLSHWNSSCVV